MSFERNYFESDKRESLEASAARAEAVTALDAFARTITQAVSRYRTLNLYLDARVSDLEGYRETRQTPDAPLRYEMYFESVQDAQSWVARKLVYAEALTQANQKEVVLKQALLMAEAPLPRVNPGLVREAMNTLTGNASRVSMQMEELGMVVPKIVIRVDLGAEGAGEVRHQLRAAEASAFAA